jgi:carbonic anhydrase/acetyltransferase-like protein (isoleucine patch superfamily)
VIRGYERTRPTLGARAFVDASAQVIGHVERAHRAEAGKTR